MGLFDTVFGGGKRAGGKRARRELQRGYDAAEGRYQPFYDAGVAEISPYQNYVNQLSDPQQYYADVMSTYEESPLAQLQTEEAIQAANQAAAASGLLGSNALYEDIAQDAQRRYQADQQRYLQNVLGIGQQFTSGAQPLLSMGGQAASALANLDVGLGEEMGRLDFMDETARAQSINNAISAGLGLAGTAFGGPMGGMMMSGFGQNFGTPGSSNLFSVASQYSPESSGGFFGLGNPDVQSFERERGLLGGY